MATSQWLFAIANNEDTGTVNNERSLPPKVELGNGDNAVAPSRLSPKARRYWLILMIRVRAPCRQAANGERAAREVHDASPLEREAHDGRVHDIASRARRVSCCSAGAPRWRVGHAFVARYGVVGGVFVGLPG